LIGRSFFPWYWKDMYLPRGDLIAFQAVFLGEKDKHVLDEASGYGGR
jgi:hypothetical protein